MQYIPPPFPSTFRCTMSSSQRTLFVTLAAQAISSVGFSFVQHPRLDLAHSRPPTKARAREPVLVDKKARRRSAPAALPSRKRHSTSLSVVSAETEISPISPLRTRRVYFIDSPPTSRPTNIQRHSNDSSELTLHSSPTSEISPSSSSSTLGHTFAIASQTLETCRESAIESDSSNSSPRPSLSLSRPFQKSRPRRSSTTSTLDIAPIITGPLPTEPTTKQQRRSSGGLIPQWSFRRASGPKSACTPASSASPTVAPTPALAPASASSSYFGRKAARRVSTPVPRTQPYAYPYYAQPPIEDENYTAYLRNLPQFTDAPLARSPVISSDSRRRPAARRRRHIRHAGPELQGAGGARAGAQADVAAKCKRELGGGKRPASSFAEC
ncbi:hypothetical protein K438DRAFT_2008187 [Mycena galopus ATCC 62051]|nr:hypothetical protein K438DRAFT_2008187 [Mycena galopus ATCC 62051]